MKFNVPKKNISKNITDIKGPGGNIGHEKRPLAVDVSYDKEAAEHFLKNGKREKDGHSFEIIKPKTKKFKFGKLLLIPLSLFLAILIFFGIGVYSKWSSLLNYFNSTSGSMSSFLSKASGVDKSKNSGANKFTVFDLAKTKSLWGNAGSIYSNFESFSAAGLGLIQEADILQKNWPAFVFNGGGQELISHLVKVKEYLGFMDKADSELNSLNIGFGDFLMHEYGSPLSFQLSFKRFDNFLGAVIKWLSLSDDRHLLVLFENSSELRPGGGFIGSYADVIFSGGSIKSFEVHDINEPDRQLLANIIPPRQLQAIEKGWTIADSNWFFDNSLSAAKTIQLMELSKMYNGNVFFDGIIAVSPKVVGDILELVGPIELPERKLTIDKGNFLTQIQNEVQTAQAVGKPSKKIISELAPKLLSKLNSLGSENNDVVTQKLKAWSEKKDIMVYFKNSDIQSSLDFYGVSGKMFQLPSDFNGNYLAVASANLGGGKSDLYISQQVLLRTQLNPDGTANNHLEISREHRAGTKDPWWYKLPNESYVQVFAPPDAALSNFSGGWNRKIVPKADYSKGYATDSLVAGIESTLIKNFNYPLVDESRESDKKVFGVWIKTDRGKTSATTIDYSTHLFSTPAEGQKYQFVFEKQFGSSGSYSFEIYAPLGFMWEESNSPVFEYQTSDPDGRIVLSLTIQKQKE